jgi:hypothetical protein
MTYSHRYIKGFREADRWEVERIVHDYGFNVFSSPEISGELEVSIAYDPTFSAKCNILEKALQEKVHSNIQIV